LLTSSLITKLIFFLLFKTRLFTVLRNVGHGKRLITVMSNVGHGNLFIIWNYSA